jgi:hypothetical protein
MRLKRTLSATLVFLVFSLVFLEVNASNITPTASANTTGTISWSGYTWTVKEGGNELWTPGPCHWTGNNVWVDQNGWLHLRISYINGKWYCAEVVTTQEFGYGTYTFKTVSRIDNFDKNVVFGMFVYKDGAHEADLEYSTWGVPWQWWNNQPGPNGWFTVQPPPVYENVTYRGFKFDMNGDYATNYIKWSQNQIYFECTGGHYAPGTAPSGNIISSFTSYKQVDPTGAHADINLWLFRGIPPSDGQSAEVVLSSFQYTPL